MLKKLVKKIIYTTNLREYYFSQRVDKNISTKNDDDFIRLSAEWLLMSQAKSGDDGYSRLYSVLRRCWDKGYIETTGYIIPTMLGLYKVYGDEKYLNSALKAGRWLLQVQNKDGSFSDIDENVRQVFDTGQCIDGLLEIYNFTGLEVYLDSAVRACKWLQEVQELDGSWIKYAFNSLPHTYYSRVSASVLKVAVKTDDLSLKEVANKNISWILGKQLDNGYFSNSGFTIKHPPLLHTIVYVLEGLLDSYDLTKDSKILNAVIKNANKFKFRNLNKEIVLLGEYDENFNPKCTYKCITGLAQWAGVALRLYELTRDSEFLECAMLSIYYLKSKQLSDGKNLLGGFYASAPPSGDYAPYQLVNWNNKFFIDTMLLYKKYNFTKNQEQENWTKYAFTIKKQIITNDMTMSDSYYCKLIISNINTLLEKGNSSINVLDLGCGHGKFMKEINSLYPNIRLVGVDQFLSDGSLNIVQGSAHNIPLASESIDLVFCVEVMQHLDNVDLVLDEIKRVLKKDGIFILCDRNPASLIGVLKPFMERLNLWMYPSDSPFAEKWYNKQTWTKKLEDKKFIIKKISGIFTSFRGIPLFNRYLVVETQK